MPLDDSDGSDAEDDEGGVKEDVLKRLSQQLSTGASAEEVLAGMPEELVKEFQQSLANGELSEHVELWKPFWSPEIAIRDIPQVVGAPPEIQSLTKVEPSSELKYHAVNVIYAYASTCRYYNGAWRDDSVNAAATFMQIARVVSENAQYQSLVDALDGSVSQAMQPSPGFPRKAAIALVRDVFDILSSKEFVDAAFFDSCGILDAGVNEMKNTLSKGECRPLKQARAKLMFFRSWFRAKADDLLLLRTDVGQYLCTWNHT